MISINNISISFSGIDLFQNISFNINDKDRIGLVGKNGSGKTTLLKIISGKLDADNGTVTKPNESSIGFLPQEIIVNSEKNIIEETLQAFSQIISLQNKIKSLTEELQSNPDHNSPYYLSLIENLNEANAQFLFYGGNDMQANTEKVLKGLGFSTDDFSRKVNEFSKGWQMRIELAKILLQKHDVILLDEPTNHLDIESIQWLEDYLINYQGAVIIVSHDRAFLDNITIRTVEISLGKIYDYKANYSEYIALHEERINQQIASYNNRQKEIRDIERFIERFRYKATKSRQVQSRIKKLDKMDKIEIDEKDTYAIHFSFPPAPHAGAVIVEAKNVSKNYDDKIILENLNFNILNGEKIAFVGKNGLGKTTLTKIITNQIDFKGFLKLGHNVSVGYYAQNSSELLDMEKTVFQTIDDIAVGDIRKNIRTILGSFLFSGDTIDKKVKVLSGGEKSRLALASLLLKPVNLLILDEPTNHLDMTSKDILKNALLNYNGTLILVSHDRDFLQGLSDKIFEFKNHSVKEFIGDIYEFLENRKIQNLDALNKNTSSSDTKSEDKSASASATERERKKQSDKILKKLNKEILHTESEITSLENEIKTLNETMSEPDFYKDFSKSESIIKNYDQLNSKLTQKMAHWEYLNQQLSNLKNNMDYNIFSE